MPSKIILTSPITSIKGIGISYTEKLNHLGIETVFDLVNHFPSRLLDFTKPSSIKALTENKPSVIIACLSEVKTFYTSTGKLMTQVTADDNSGKIKLIWFNNPYIKRLIKEGDLYTIAGKPTHWAGKLTLVAPTIEHGNSLSLNTSGMVPVYPQTEGVTSRWLRSKIYSVLESLTIIDPLDERFLSENSLLDFSSALRKIHFAQSTTEHFQADKRISFNEHLKINLTNLLAKRSLGNSVSLSINQGLYIDSVNRLPFKLTIGQKKAIESIFSDLATSEPTHRLLQGDTGSGKTIPMILSADQAVNNNYSVAIMAPTEILANQHLVTFSQLSSFPKNIQLITGSNKEAPHDHKPMIYIGTHALLSKIPTNLKYPLALIAVDEQHKFGVRQREELANRTPVPHILNLSATPIPRTVALGLIGDIELTNIRSQPLNRVPTKTHIVDPERYKKSTSWLSKKLEEGNNFFVVCPNITEKNTGVATVESVAKDYQRKFPKFHVTSLHGKLDKETQVKTLEDFRSSSSNILVATSLIEVGIDIPQANIMIVHSAERFGLAQLHQLRGRVGRGGGQGYFFLVPTTADEAETDRLKLLQKYDSGLVLAQKDLRLRGAGEVFGSKQHGSIPVRLKYFWSKSLFLKAKNMAKTMIKNNPDSARFLLSKLTFAD